VEYLFITAETKWKFVVTFISQKKKSLFGKLSSNAVKVEEKKKKAKRRGYQTASKNLADHGCWGKRVQK